MAVFEKPNIVVSKCLGFDACRYNGQMLKNSLVDKLSKHVRYIPVCAEVEIGLGVPRFPIRVVASGKGERLVQPGTGRDVSEKMERFSSRFLGGLSDVDGFILKSRSPSCGIKDVRIYHGIGKASVAGKGAGFFGKAAMSSFPDKPVEEEGRLSNFRIREHFLARIFQGAALRKVLAKGKISGLSGFHARNKFLLMAGNQNEMRALGRVAANMDGRPFEDAAAEYEERFGKCLRHVPKKRSLVNVMMHISGFFSKTLSGREKRFFLQTVELYREGRIPFSSALNVLKAWAVRDNNGYLLEQSLFRPYPEELMELTFSGKPIEM